MIKQFLLAKHGSIALMATVALVAVIGFASIAVDVGHVYSVRNELQAGTNAAAMAGAKAIGNGGDPTADATTYSSGPGGKNQISGVTTTTTVSLQCLQAALACTTNQTPATAINTVVVTQTASVPLYFAQVLGFSSISITTEAAALAAGTAPQPLNIEFVEDATASMGSNDSSCGTTRLGCAIEGFKTLLGELWPCQYNTTCTTSSTPIDQAALLQFPGVKTLPSSGSCGSLATVSYANSPLYQIIPLSADYRTTDTSALNTASNLVKCLNGLKPPGGFGTFYADAISAAQADLVKNGKSGVQNVIILLSDGEANAKSSDVPSGKANNQCHQAVQNANAAAAAGTWVFTVSYGTSSSGGCTTDSGSYANACWVLGQIASDPSKFYADDAAGCKSTVHPTITALQQVFQNIAYSLTTPRLLPLACLQATAKTPAPAGCTLIGNST